LGVVASLVFWVVGGIAFVIYLAVDSPPQRDPLQQYMARLESTAHTRTSAVATQWDEQPLNTKAEAVLIDRYPDPNRRMEARRTTWRKLGDDGILGWVDER
jgi:hypothetical protein